VFFCVCLDCYDETDTVPERETLTVDVKHHVVDVTESDNPELVPSYADFLIAYPTQSCKLNIDG